MELLKPQYPQTPLLLVDECRHFGTPLVCLHRIRIAPLHL